MNAEQVLDFWFGETPGEIRREWFVKNEAFDEEIRTRFGEQIEKSLAGDLPATPRDKLAAIIVLDQFTRNAFRGQPRAFAGDGRALKLALELLDSGVELDPLQRWFALMPLEHAEDLAMQDRSVREFKALAAVDARLEDALDYARRHREVIVRFGRYPHRNAILGRASTPEEIEFLKQPGSGF